MNQEFSNTLSKGGLGFPSPLAGREEVWAAPGGTSVFSSQVSFWGRWWRLCFISAAKHSPSLSPPEASLVNVQNCCLKSCPVSFAPGRQPGHWFLWRCQFKTLNSCWRRGDVSSLFLHPWLHMVLGFCVMEREEHQCKCPLEEGDPLACTKNF